MPTRLTILLAALPLLSDLTLATSGDRAVDSIFEFTSVTPRAELETKLKAAQAAYNTARYTPAKPFIMHGMLGRDQRVAELKSQLRQGVRITFWG